MRCRRTPQPRTGLKERESAFPSLCHGDLSVSELNSLFEGFPVVTDHLVGNMSSTISAFDMRSITRSTYHADALLASRAVMLDEYGRSLRRSTPCGRSSAQGT